MHATEFLKAPDKHAPGGLVVLVGDQDALAASVAAALRGRLLGGEDEDLSATRLAGKDAEWRAVADDLHTVSMFGDHRLVQVDEADDFVSRHRPQLEDYADKPAASGTLVLRVTKWQKTTRLAKKLVKMQEAATGLLVECTPLTGAKLTAYLTSLAKSRHKKKLPREAAALMVELVGDSLGLLEQEVDKLASFAGEAAEITTEDVTAVVGGWKTETTWKMLDAVRDGDVGRALKLYGDLFEAGEAPQKTMGGLGFSYRKLCKAVETSRLGKPLPAALKDAGFFRDSDRQVPYLKRVTRKRAELFLLELQRTDAGLKGGSALDERTQMERLLVALS